MGYWKKHPKKELERVLEEFDAAGWHVDDPPTYYRVRCPCGDHMRWIHLTPSSSNYARNALKWLCTSTVLWAGRAVMSTTTVGVSEEFAVQNVSRESLEVQCGRVMETLLALEGTGCLITSPAVSLDLATSTVTIEVDASGRDFGAAVALAERCINCAIREATGTDPKGWDYQQRQRHAELVDA